MAIRNISEDELEQVGGGVSFSRNESKKSSNQNTVKRFCPHCQAMEETIPLSGGRYYCTNCEKEFTEKTLSGEGLKNIVC